MGTLREEPGLNYQDQTNQRDYASLFYCQPSSSVQCMRLEKNMMRTNETLEADRPLKAPKQRSGRASNNIIANQSRS